MSEDLGLKETQREWHGSYSSYVVGFILSLFLTILSFTLVTEELLIGSTLVYTLTALAIFQAVIQIIFFLHLGHEDYPQWETLVFSFMILVLLVIALGTLWIMYDLNERVMAGM